VALSWVTTRDLKRSDVLRDASRTTARRLERVRGFRRLTGEGAKYDRQQRSDVKEFRRKQLLERIEREGATVGAEIPERITVQGEEVDLREFVFEIRRLERVPPGERERVEQAKKNLRRERLQRKQRIEAGELGYEEGERLARAIIGIDRALNALEGLGPVDLEREASVQERADRERWMRFLKKALGHDQQQSARRGR